MVSAALPDYEGGVVGPGSEEPRALVGNVRIIFVGESAMATTASSAAAIYPLEIVQASTGDFRPSVGTHIEAEWRRLQMRRAGDPAYEPARTPLGAELRRLRAKIIESGEPLLSWKDIEKEVTERRGGVG